MAYALGSSLLLLLLGLVTRRLLVDNFGPQITTASQVVSQLFNFFSIAEFGVGSVISYRLYEQIAAKNEEKISKYMSMYKWAYRAVGSVIALLALCGLRLAEGFTGQGFSKQMDDICWYFLPFQNEDGQMLVWAYEAIVAAVALVIVLVQGRRQKIAGRTLETGLTIISVMQVLLDSWRADELIRFGFVRLNMLMAALTLAVLLASRLTRCIRRDGLKRISIARIVMLLLGAGVCIAVEFALDKSAINNGILYGVMMLALVPMFIAVLLDDGRIQTAEERK